jgi:hypothetical protein
MIKYTIKTILCHLITTFAVSIGIISMFHFFTNSGFINVIYAIGSMFIFLPAMSYWYEISKRLLNIKDNE